MTIQELKEKKQALEQEIADKLQDFEKETKTKILSMDIVETMTYEGDDFDFNMFKIKIEVKL